MHTANLLARCVSYHFLLQNPQMTQHAIETQTCAEEVLRHKRQYLPGTPAQKLAHPAVQSEGHC